MFKILFFRELVLLHNRYFHIMKQLVMKSGILVTATILLSIVTAAQIGIKPPVQKTMPLNSPLQLVQGKDLIIRIDRFVDNSILDKNIYQVYYTVTNMGTEDIDLTQVPVKFNGTFYEVAVNIFRPDGQLTALSSTGTTVLKSGSSISGSFSIASQLLRTNIQHRYVLKIDCTEKLPEANENNNTAEILVIPRAVRNGDYFLSAAKLIIQTGNDNKEANNSHAYFFLGVANANESVYFYKGSIMNKTPYLEEIRANSTTEIVLDRYVNQQGILSDYNALCVYKYRGMALAIIYDNKSWATDAWKINGVTAVLTFKDRGGNPYPNGNNGVFTFNFPNTGVTLGYRPGDDITTNKDQLRVLTLGSDGNFNPLGPEVKKYTGSPFLRLDKAPIGNAPMRLCN